MDIFFRVQTIPPDIRDKFHFIITVHQKVIVLHLISLYLLTFLLDNINESTILVIVVFDKKENLLCWNLRMVKSKRPWRSDALLNALRSFNMDLSMDNLVSILSCSDPGHHLQMIRTLYL
ncbi:hypothetical protein HW35_03625 [Bacillus sp. X1(2014)]|nr:hypothetical protein HW35_03625 [Bacillus sp. X1(2014)]